MGNVIAATLHYQNGTTARLSLLDDLTGTNQEGCLELEYAYGLHLLSSPDDSYQGLWQFPALMPFDRTHRRFPQELGNTPLLALPQLRARSGLPSLWLKDETRSPTGSNKDRATALILEYALQQGYTTACCASTGNAALSLAIGCATIGMRAVIFVPAHVSETKLTLMLLAGACVFKVAEGYKAAVMLSRAAARAFGWMDRNTGYNPLSLEAKKTVSFEIWQQLDGQIPDVVVIPVGDGVTLSGIAKGFRELLLCGAIARLPRIIGVQSSSYQPLIRSWLQLSPSQEAGGSTIADGIAVSEPINGPMALRDVRESQGSFLAVSDDAIRQAMVTLATLGGIIAEPAGAAAFAGMMEAQKKGLIHHNETVVALVTGTGMKNPQLLRTLASNNVFSISADLDEVRQHVI